MKKYFNFLFIISLIVLLQSCSTTGKKVKSVHGDKPLIDTAEIIVKGREEMDKKIIDGPKPYDTEVVREDKRKTINPIIKDSFFIDYFYHEIVDVFRKK